MQNILKMMDIATGADIKALQKEIRLLKNAGRSASTAKRVRRTTAGGTRKKTARPVARKRTTASAKKRALLRVPGSVRQVQGAKSLPPEEKNDFRRGRPLVIYNFMDVPKLHFITSAIIFFRNSAPTAVLRFSFDFSSASDRDLSFWSSAKLSIPASEILLTNVRCAKPVLRISL